MSDIDAPRGEVAALVAVQSALGRRPEMLAGARVLSHFGEHSLGWLAVAGVGALLQPSRRKGWLLAGIGALAAHAAAVVIKHVVRRQRPSHPAVAVGGSTPSQLSFPSAHATSTTAAAVLMTPMAGRAFGLVVVPMAVSRLVLGVHYPSDVFAGMAVGAVVGTVVKKVGTDAIGGGR